MPHRSRELGADAKLVRLVLDDRGPLAAPEVAEESFLPVERVRDAVADLERAGLAEPVCGVCADREEVYALTDRGPGAAGRGG